MSRRRVGDPRSRKGIEAASGLFFLRKGLTEPGGISPRDAFDLIAPDFIRQAKAGTISKSATNNYRVDALSFVEFCEKHEVKFLWEIDVNFSYTWIFAPSKKNKTLAINTMYRKRSALRAFFTTAVNLGLIDLNVAYSVELPARIPPKNVRFSQEEVQRLRDVSPLHVLSSKLPAILALILIGASTREVAGVRVQDVQFTKERVWLGDTGERRTPRWVPLPKGSWEYKAISRRVRDMKKKANSNSETKRVLLDANICYSPIREVSMESPTESSNKAQAAICNSVMKIVKTARIEHSGSGIPERIRRAAARALFDETNRIDIVAERFGYRSLDAAADYIGYDWAEHITASNSFEEEN
jgi:site-specific recombinase XerD